MNLIIQRLAAIGMVAVSFASAAQAASQRTFVSGTGSDANPCSLSAPCRSFAGALVNTLPGGEIYVLDTAGYGSLTINQAVSIVNQTSTAGATATSGNVITIAAGPTDKIVLRGLTIVGADTAANGILFTSGGSLSVEDCSINDFTGEAILFQPTNVARLYVSNTRVANTPGAGIDVVPQMPSGSGTVYATFNHVTGNNNGGSPFFIDGRNSGSNVKIAATIANSVGSTSTQGITTATTAGHAAVTVMVRNATLSNNGIGLNSSGPLSTVFVGHSTLTGNNIAIGASGTLDSYGDNDINGNNMPGVSPGSVAFH